MSYSHPVLIIHGTSWCAVCKHILKEENFSKIRKLALNVNPNTEFKIVYHDSFDKTNKVEQYPPVNYIPFFPCIMITSSDNCNKFGSMDRVRINGAIWDGKSIKKNDGKSMVSIENFIRQNLNSV